MTFNILHYTNCLKITSEEAPANLVVTMQIARALPMEEIDVIKQLGKTWQEKRITCALLLKLLHTSLIAINAQMVFSYCINRLRVQLVCFHLSRFFLSLLNKSDLNKADLWET